MYFADFRNLKIITDFTYSTKHIDLQVSNPMSIKDLQALVSEELAKLDIFKTSIPTLYQFNITGSAVEEHAEVDEVVNFIVSLANIITPTLLRKLETGKGYKRERRLDVPDTLKPLHASRSCIKKACNHKILTPVINIQIIFGNISFLLCDGHELDNVKEGGSNE